MTATEIYDLIKIKLGQLIQETREALGETKRLSIEIAWKTFQIGIAQICVLIEELQLQVEGKEKKEAALKALSEFFDIVVIAVDIPFLPDLLERAFDKFTKVLFMRLASGSVDATVTILRQTTIFLKEKQDVSGN